MGLEPNPPGPIEVEVTPSDVTPPPPPILSSSTHPNENNWYNNNDPLFTWTTPSDASGIAGYRYTIDHFSSTTHDTSVDIRGNSKLYTNLADGTWYFHVIANDNAGNWGSADHYRVKIDTNQPPTAIIDSITPDPAEQGTDTVSFTGHGTDTDGTEEAYNWSSSIDGPLSTSAAFSKPASELSVGTHTIYFKVQDNDGTWSTEDTEDLTICPGPELSYSPESHDFCDMREGEADNTTFELRNSGTGTLTYSLSESCGGWVDVHPTGGSSTGEHDTITVDINTTGLSEDTHTCDISINSNDGSGTFTVTVNVVPYPESSWTYMVYLDGDNNLEGAGIGDFMEMSSVGSSPTVNIVVQFDRIPGYVSSYGDWTTCKRFLVTQGMTPTAANAISDLGECNMGDPNTLRDFVEWAMTNFPADNYALILWNHGSGWKSINNWVPWADDLKDAKDAGLTRGICVDNTNNDYLSLQETEVALTGKYVQLLGYDACLMHMIEVVYQVRTNAGVSVGSEEVEPWYGWPYDTILNDLTVTPTMTEYTLGTVIVDRYMASYPTRDDLTQSAMDNSALPNLVAVVDNLAQALMTEINAGHVADVQQARNAAEEIYYLYSSLQTKLIDEQFFEFRVDIFCL